MHPLCVNAALAVVVRETTGDELRRLRAALLELHRASGFVVAGCGHADDARALQRCACAEPASRCAACARSAWACQSWRHHVFCERCDERAALPCGCRMCAECAAERTTCLCGRPVCRVHGGEHEIRHVQEPAPADVNGAWHYHCALQERCDRCERALLEARPRGAHLLSLLLLWLVMWPAGCWLTYPRVSLPLLTTWLAIWPVGFWWARKR